MALTTRRILFAAFASSKIEAWLGLLPKGGPTILTNISC